MLDAGCWMLDAGCWMQRNSRSLSVYVKRRTSGSSIQYLESSIGREAGNVQALSALQSRYAVTPSSPITIQYSRFRIMRSTDQLAGV